MDRSSRNAGGFRAARTTGARGGVIGVKREQSISVFRSHMPMRYDSSDVDPWLMAVVIRTARHEPGRIRVRLLDEAGQRQIGADLRGPMPAYNR